MQADIKVYRQMVDMGLLS
ncbi:MAG: hypothetical protein Q9M40_01900 [Sulfurimonas sp.]|nr:hypothetical protein [Sulfurimonas sp.]